MRAFKQDDGGFGIEIFYQHESRTIYPVQVRDMADFFGQIECNNLKVFCGLTAGDKKGSEAIEPYIQTSNTLLDFSGIEQLEQAEGVRKNPELRSNINVRISNDFEEYLKGADRPARLGIGDLRFDLAGEKSSLNIELSKSDFRTLQEAVIKKEAQNLSIELALHKYKADRMDENRYLHFWRSDLFEIYTISQFTLESGHIENSSILSDQLKNDAFTENGGRVHIGVDAVSMIWNN